MTLPDKRFWNKCDNIIDGVFFCLFVAFAVLLTVDLWGLLITAILYLIDEGTKLILLLKILGTLCIVLILFSHFALWQIMYSPQIYKRLISIVWNKKLWLLKILTIGYLNVYLLNLYFIRFKYDLYELTQYRVNVTYSTLVMFPIMNIPIYVAIMRKKEHSLSIGETIKLYLLGNLATYLIKSDYSDLIQGGMNGR